MLIKKRGQISANTFVYLFSVVVIALVLLIGYRYISTTKETISKTDLLQFKTKLTHDVETIGRDFGTFKKVSYSVPGSAQLCLVDLRDENDKITIDGNEVIVRDTIIESELIKYYPLIKDSVVSNVKKNAFIIGPKTFESYYIGDLKFLDTDYPYFKCIEPVSGKINFGIEGTGRQAKILTKFETSVVIPTGRTTRDYEVEFPDGFGSIIIPQGRMVTFPGTDRKLSVKMIDPNEVPAGGKASNIYEFEPSGTIFLDGAEFPITLSPDQECKDSPQLHVLNIHVGSATVPDTYNAHTCEENENAPDVAIFTIHRI